MTTKEEHLVELEDDLAPWLPREKEMGRILSAAATASMTFDKEIEAVENSLNIRTANTKEEVVKASQAFDIEPKKGESLKQFKRRALRNYNSLTIDGSPQGMLESVSTLFNIPENRVEIENVVGEPVFEVKTLDRLDPEFNTVNETLKLLLDLTAANYSINFFTVGTLDYISKEDRTNDSYDSSNGYATLDNNDNVTSGGTYSGYRFRA